MTLVTARLKTVEEPNLDPEGNGQKTAPDKQEGKKSATAIIHLGETQFGSGIDWSVSIRTNAHLMMVGLLPWRWNG